MSEAAQTAQDNPDLEALFDSIVAQNHAPRSPQPQEPTPPAPVSQPAQGGDSGELEALFDSIATATAAAPPAPEIRPEPPAARTRKRKPQERDDLVFKRLGRLTRTLHDSLRELGYDQALEKAAAAIPDAQDRLNYVAGLTEQAAQRALTAIEAAQPLQDRLETGALALGERWQKLYDRQLSVDEFRQLAAETRDFLRATPESARATKAQLLEIMMAQDFQDLTGQVIKRINEMVRGVEEQLVQLLIENAPSSPAGAAGTAGLLNGPVVKAGARTDVVTSQKQVDDLLESLGF